MPIFNDGQYIRRRALKSPFTVATLTLGDLVFARTGVATYINAAGELATAADGIPRAGVPGPIVRRNLIANSENISLWGSKSAAFGVAIDGAYNAISDASAAACVYAYDANYPVPVNSTVAAQVKIKKAASVTGYPSVSIDFSGATGVNNYYLVDPVNGLIIKATSTASTEVSKSIVSSGDDWLVTIVITDTQNNTAARLVLYPAMRATFTTGGEVAAAVGSILVRNPQLEIGNTATLFQMTNATGVDLSEYTKNAGSILEMAANQYLTTPGTPATQTVSLTAGTYTLSMDGAGSVVAYPASANLVTNGDFATGDLTGWTILNDVTYDSGTAKLVGGANAWLTQAITCVVGATYRITFNVTAINLGAGVCVGTSLRGFQTLNGNISVSVGVKTFNFTATATTQYLSFLALPANYLLNVDNITCIRTATATGATPATYTLAAPADVTFTVTAPVTRFNCTNLPFRTSYIPGASRGADSAYLPITEGGAAFWAAGKIDASFVLPIGSNIAAGTKIFDKSNELIAIQYASTITLSRKSNGGLRTVTINKNAADGGAHTLTATWTRGMLLTIDVDGTTATIDASALYGDTSWEEEQGVYESDGLTNSTIVSFTPSLL